MRKFLLILTILLPQQIKIFLYKKLLNYQIGNNVEIGFSYLDASEVKISDNVRIGHFNIIRGIEILELGESSYIGNFNQLFGGRDRKVGWSSQFILGKKVLIMSHHFMDITGNIFIGNQTTIAGRDTHFWSHSLINSQDGLKRITFNINIGENCYVGARATLVGCNVPDRSIVGAGSVVTKKFASEDNYILIAGNPAVIKKRYNDKQPITS
jgi:acetyltransferase-like isoleucine patch superfamily enzyme